MVQGVKLQVVIRLIKFHIFIIALLHFKNWRKTIRTVTLLKEQIRKYIGPHSIQKIACVDGRYYWDMYGEGWPSAGFVRNVKRECIRINSSPTEHVGMRNVLFGFTVKCPMQCDHCFEWDNLNLKERLAYTDVCTITEKLINYGVGQIHLGGGEPMMRYAELISLLKLYSPFAGFWIVTSGYQLTKERAMALKAAGLTGVCVSIDHHDEQKHNEFRHHKNLFAMAKEAAAVSREAGLVTALSLCATKEFITADNLNAYMRMAKELNVSFVQLLEPRAIGHYAGKDVQLSANDNKLLEQLFLQVNYQKAYKEYPNVIYHEYYKPTLGCRGGGNGAFYIDPLAQVHACPFCRKSAGNLLTDSVAQCVDKLKIKGCDMPAPLPAIRRKQQELAIA